MKNQRKEDNRITLTQNSNSSKVEKRLSKVKKKTDPIIKNNEASEKTSQKDKHAVALKEKGHLNRSQRELSLSTPGMSFREGGIDNLSEVC